MRAKTIIKDCTHLISAAKVATFFWEKYPDVRKNIGTESSILCDITRHSALFYERIRWSILYTKHVLARFLRQLLMPSREDFKSISNPTIKPTNWIKDIIGELLNWLNLLRIDGSKSTSSDASSKLNSFFEDTMNWKPQRSQADRSLDG